MMKQWPDFNERGDLPAGIHRATLAEVLEHFGSGLPQRRITARRLAHIYALAAGTGHLARFIIVAENYEGASIFWIRRLAALEGEEATVAYWQLKRDRSKRGIVEVVEDD